ncbi:hypothetical protein [Rhizobium leguminosarum]|uniref:hypothetical protein n=1 Tax=Rhizobium leguminosarum TaxID=384 RepID=UPI001441C64E|nr:hypothetical protein [Rhizobium leguminosarum]MBY5869793.1 hypothetical protein [Rhizobium leguminosarum]NKM09003.1 hypothetical protein [Rhizobium leguminosarum bv. viciae]
MAVVDRIDPLVAVQCLGEVVEIGTRTEILPTLSMTAPRGSSKPSLCPTGIGEIRGEPSNLPWFI